MDALRERGLVFGVSLTITRENVEEVTSDAFIDFLLEKGVVYGWSFHYIPIGREPNPELMITPEQRAYLVERVAYIRNHKGLQLADFWNDGELTLGCIAGGRRYFHITASGDVEPCAFIHFSLDNIKEKSLMEVLQSPLFRAYQQRQPFSDNLLRPCPLIDVPAALREIVATTGARPTHPGAETALSGPIGAYLDTNAARWAAVADRIWQERHPVEAEKELTAGK
jgi:MoaA/NifB/PqqE/SkfB family radical SAM enzyme